MKINKALAVIFLLIVMMLALALNVYADEKNNISVVEVMSTDPCIRIKLENPVFSGTVKDVKYAVWSSEGGQDDLVWYNATLKNGIYQKDVNLNKHKSTGIYNIHCYVTYSDGSMKFFTSSKFIISVPYGDKISVSDLNLNKGTFVAKVTGVQNRIGAEYVSIGIKNSGYSDQIYWYKAERNGISEFRTTVDISKFAYSTGEYYVYATIKDLDGNYNNLNPITVNVEKSVSDIVVTDVNNNESDFRIDVNNPVIPGGFKDIRIAVWSKTGGQDDLVWYNATKNGSTYTVSVPVKSHKTMGYYYVHVYALNNSNKMVLLGATDFSVDNNPTADINVEYIDKINGKMFIRVSNINAPAGISNVQIPVWSGKDYSNIKWYKAKAESDGTYTVLADISNHKKLWGKYNIYAYIDMNNGISGYADSTYYYMTKNSSDKISENIVNAELISIEKSGTYHLSMNLSDLGFGFNHIEYAVWSNTYGKDDILWFKAENNSSVFEADVSMLLFKDYGKYNVNAYAVKADGSRVLIKEGSFSLEKPSRGKITASDDNRAKGTFKVTVSDIKNTSAVNKVLVGAKSSAKNAEIVWYEAKKTSDGKYVVTVDIKNHAYETGTYTVYSKITDFRNVNHHGFETSYNINVIYDPFVVYDYDNTERNIGVMIKNLSIPGGFKNIKYAVWSKDGGQDDIRWYDCLPYYGSYYYYVPIDKHKTLGHYYVHVYYTSPDGKLHFLDDTGFSIESKACGSITASEINGNTGKFKVTVSNIKALSGVNKVQIPVWSTSNQNDIKWYEATKQSDGTYVAIVDVKNHKYNFGTYNAHAYVTMGNGIRNIVSATKVNISPSNYLKVEKLNEGKARLTLMNAGNGYANSVSFPTWSSNYGQDDIKWYNASYVGNGNWSAVVETKNHKSYGEYITHAYVKYNGKNKSVASAKYTLKGLDYSELLARFTTVSQNNANGTYNMSKALLSFNGLIVQPGQTVSFFNVAGPCGKYQGYLVAGTVQGTGYGGGICQASTTLYGGALRAGMTIVERRSHSSKSVYVPVGQDAMVSYGSSDFKFRNDHSRPVKIVTYVIGKTLYCEFWGIQADWYDDVVVNSWATGSKTAAAERIFYKNGVIVKRERLTNSYYPKS